MNAWYIPVHETISRQSTAQLDRELSRLSIPGASPCEIETLINEIEDINIG
jgi:hypothetical protein